MPPFACSSKFRLWLWMVNPFVWIIWVVDTIFWLATIVGPLLTAIHRAMTSSLMSVATGDAGECIRVCTPNPEPEGLRSNVQGGTLYEVLEVAFKRFGRFKALGTQSDSNEVSWCSFSELHGRAEAFGLGLRKLGMKPLPLLASRACTDLGVKLPDDQHSLLIFQDAGSDWITAAIGAMSQSMPLVTLHASLPILAVAAVIKDTRSPGMGGFLSRLVASLST
jgi:hypothetical protein